MNRFLRRLVDDEIAKLVYTARLSGRYVELVVIQSEFIDIDLSWPAFGGVHASLRPFRPKKVQPMCIY